MELGRRRLFVALSAMRAGGGHLPADRESTGTPEHWTQAHTDTRTNTDVRTHTQLHVHMYIDKVIDTYTQTQRQTQPHRHMDT